MIDIELIERALKYYEENKAKGFKSYCHNISCEMDGCYLNKDATCSGNGTDIAVKAFFDSTLKNDHQYKGAISDAILPYNSALLSIMVILKNNTTTPEQKLHFINDNINEFLEDTE